MDSCSSRSEAVLDDSIASRCHCHFWYCSSLLAAGQHIEAPYTRPAHWSASPLRCDVAKGPLGDRPGRGIYRLYITHPGSDCWAGAINANPITQSLATITQQRATQFSDTAQYDLSCSAYPGRLDRSIHPLWFERDPHSTREFLSSSLDGAWYCRVVSWYLLRHEYLAVLTHRIQVVSVPACHNIEHLVG